ncbi:gastrin/cholecystokinin type B receptor [Alosa sapidissima]|uniref:gastrin/cholecystokinin type B receptor n=1 Tax=Alosa sapidissima TaxID=34773 RepID=UPI001C092975|nr:gastrin/cholecystokinin type B receptor [Alosa sapidissima]
MHRQREGQLSRMLLLSGHEPSTIVLVIMYIISFLVGLTGNIMALLVLTRRRNRLSAVSATRRLLVNLAVCDMMVVCVCMPVNLGHQLYNAWVFGDLLCRAVPFVQAVSVAASVLSLAVISLNRYYSVHNPLHARSFFTGRKIICMICVVWTLSSGLCLPLIFMNATRTLDLLDGAHSITVCVESWPKVKLRQGYNFLLFCALYGFPVLFNLAICFMTAWKLWSSEDKFKQPNNIITQSTYRSKTRKKIAKMVIALVLLFTISWLPLYVVDIWLDFNIPTTTEHDPVEQVRHEWILQGRPFAQWLGLTNSALNPLCYCFVGNLYRSAKRFRKSYNEKLSSIFSMQQSSVSRSNSEYPSFRRASSRRGAPEGHGWTSCVSLKEKLTKSKSMSSITVLETTFD